MNIFCKLGWHHWSKWKKDDDNWLLIDVYKRECDECGKVQHKVGDLG